VPTPTVRPAFARALARAAACGLCAVLAAAGCRAGPRARGDLNIDESLTIAEGFLAQDDYLIAKAVYGEISKRSPDDGMAHLGLARAALGLGDFQGALHELNLAENGKYMDAAALQSVQIIRGRTYIRMRKPPIIVWAYLYPIWRKGDTAVKSCLDAEIKALAKLVPPETEGARDVIGFVPPPREALPELPHVAEEEPEAPPIVTGPLSVLPRSRWNPALAAKVGQMQSMGTPTRLTIHHSAHDDVDSSETVTGTARLIRSMQEFHIRDRDWADIAYHYIIDPKGRVWEGRNVKFQGAHAGSDALNKNNIGIVLMGDFEDHPPTPASVASLKLLIAHLRKTYGIAQSGIFGHQDLHSTKCPGRYLEAIVKQVRGKA
jgi:hypothetical protein